MPRVSNLSENSHSNHLKVPHVVAHIHKGFEGLPASAWKEWAEASSGYNERYFNHMVALLPIHRSYTMFFACIFFPDNKGEAARLCTVAPKRLGMTLHLSQKDSSKNRHNSFNHKTQKANKSTLPRWTKWTSPPTLKPILHLHPPQTYNACSPNGSTSMTASNAYSKLSTDSEESMNRERKTLKSSGRAP